MTTASKGLLDRILESLGLLWERTHIVGFGKPQVQGVTSVWCQGLSPIGDREIGSGELVELHAVFEAPHQISAASGLRFDILEEDFFLTGGLDDLVASLVTEAAPAPPDGYQVLPRVTIVHRLTATQALADYVQQFKRDHPHYDSFILLVTEAGDAAPTHALAWWRAHYVDDFGNSELYFVVRTGDGVADGTEQVLDVSARPGAYLEVTGRVIDPAGNAVTGAVVIARNGAGGAVGSARTDATGDYRLDLAFETPLTLMATNGFVSTGIPVTPTDQHRREPLVAPAITVTGLSLTATVSLPSWREPRTATPAADRGTLPVIANHFRYTAPAEAIPGPTPVAAVAEAFAPATYDFDRGYAGLPLGGMELVMVKDVDPNLTPDDWAGLEIVLGSAEEQMKVAVASRPMEPARRGIVTFNHCLEPGNYLLAPRRGYRFVGRAADGRVDVAPSAVARFLRITIAADGAIAVGGRPWDGRVHLLPVVEPAEWASRGVIDTLADNLRITDRAVLSGLVDTGRIVDVARLAPMLDAEERDAVLQHIALRQPDGRTTLLLDHGLLGFASREATDRAPLPWIPLTDSLLTDAHAAIRDDATSADYARSPLKFITDAAADGRLRAREKSREVGDDIREVAIRLLLWGSATEWIDPNRPAFDARLERAVVRFKAGLDGKKTPRDAKAAQLSYWAGAGAKATALFPDHAMSTSFTGICDLVTYRALDRFVSALPRAEFAFAAFGVAAPHDADNEQFGRKGVDRILVYALQTLGQRLPGQRLRIETGIRPWPRHTLDASRRDLSVSHPEGYGVKVRTFVQAASLEDRITVVESLRRAAVRFGGQNAKAGPPGEVANLLPPLPVGLTAALREGQLVVAPKSWLEQGTDASELGADHRAPVKGEPGVPWRIEEMGLNIQLSGNHRYRWDPPYNVPPPPNGPLGTDGPLAVPAAAGAGEGIGFTSMSPARMRSAWEAHREAVSTWALWYRVPSELVLAMMGTESNFSGLGYRVEEPQPALLNSRWAALCPGTPAPAVGTMVPAAAMATACAQYNAWGQDYHVLKRANSVDPSPSGNARVSSIETVVEAFAPDRISPGMLQTLITTARQALDSELRPNTQAIVGTRWLLRTYDPTGDANAIRAGTSYMRYLADHRGTRNDPPLVSSAYNHGSVERSPNPSNRWRLFQDPDQKKPTCLKSPADDGYAAELARSNQVKQERWDRAGGHTNRLVGWFNDAVRELRQSPDRPADGFHAYDDLHLDTLMLHHSKWELEWVMGQRTTGPVADPAHAQRAAPAQRLTTLANGYTRTNPPPYPPVNAPAVAPTPPTSAQQATALRALTEFVASNLDSYLTDSANPGSRVYARLLWTFAKDETSAKGVGWNHNLRLAGRLTDSLTDAPLPGVRIEVQGARAVTTSPSGHFVVSALMAPLPAIVRIVARSHQFVSTAVVLDTAYPGSILAPALSTHPIAVTPPAAPRTGPAIGGTVLNIAGTGFVAGATTVKFGAPAGTSVVSTETQITVTTPLGLPGPVDLAITSAHGTCTVPGGFTYT